MGSSRWVAVLKLYSPVLNIALHEAPQDERGLFHFKYTVDLGF